MEIVKDGAIGGVGGGVLGGGGGSLYGLYDNKKNDESYRAAYATCMKQRWFSS